MFQAFVAPAITAHAKAYISRRCVSIQLASMPYGKAVGGVKAAEHSRDVLLLNKRIEQLLIQLITAQPFKSERLVVWNIVLFGAEIDPQTLLKERAYRVLPEAQELIERQAVNRRRGERLYKIAMRLPAGPAAASYLSRA